MGNGKLKGSLGSSDHEMMELKTLRLVKRAYSKLLTLDFRRADVGLFRSRCLVEYHGTQESWLISKHCSFKLQIGASQ